MNTVNLGTGLSVIGTFLICPFVAFVLGFVIDIPNLSRFWTVVIFVALAFVIDGLALAPFIYIAHKGLKRTRAERVRAARAAR